MKRAENVGPKGQDVGALAVGGEESGRNPTRFVPVVVAAVEIGAKQELLDQLGSGR